MVRRTGITGFLIHEGEQKDSGCLIFDSMMPVSKANRDVVMDF